jgi:hypothetical protein
MGALTPSRRPSPARHRIVDRHRRKTAGPGARVYQSAKTVRTHQRMLGADGRRDVVQRARELRIV